jgi:hypothetical protein
MRFSEAQNRLLCITHEAVDHLAASLREWPIGTLCDLIVSVAGSRPETSAALIELVFSVTTKVEFAPVVAAVARSRTEVEIAKRATYDAAARVAIDIAALDARLVPVDHRAIAVAEGSAALRLLGERMSSIVDVLPPSAHDAGVASALWEAGRIRIEPILDALKEFSGVSALTELAPVVLSAFRDVETRLAGVEEAAGMNALANELDERFSRVGDGRAAKNIDEAWAAARGAAVKKAPGDPRSGLWQRRLRAMTPTS